MIVSSRTPEGEPNRCPICGSAVLIDPSDPAREAPCPDCGHLLWFSKSSVTVIQFENDGDLAEGQLGRLVEGLARPRMLLDFRNVRELPSHVLSALILLAKKTSASQGQLVLCNLRAEILEVFLLTRLDRLLDIRVDEAEGLAAFAA